MGSAPPGTCLGSRDSGASEAPAGQIPSQPLWISTNSNTRPPRLLCVSNLSDLPSKLRISLLQTRVTNHSQGLTGPGSYGGKHGHEYRHLNVSDGRAQSAVTYFEMALLSGRHGNSRFPTATL